MKIHSCLVKKKFLEFFFKKEHVILPGSPLVDNKDESLLFTNSGMNQFKDVFLGKKICRHSKVATIQQCLRTGGKHNDLYNVGRTSRHHTFFEMLGNFSFNSYFKEEAISYAWEFLTKSNYLNFSKNRLWITTYYKDKETYKIWNKKFNIPSNRIVKIEDCTSNLYDSDNFWQMGKTGPCGPCTEIFFDRGNSFKGSPPGSGKDTGERFIEIWNLVFMQFNRIDQSTLIPLPQILIDTGMGLERVVTIIQNVCTAYETDLFKDLIENILEISNIKNYENSSIRIIADHIRSITFILSNGVIPSNEKHGYVLRRIIRRALMYGKKLGMKHSFLQTLVTIFIKKTDDCKSFSKDKVSFIIDAIRKEEDQFSYILDKGISILTKKIETSKNNILDGKTIFYLYDTCGFPVDLTKDICEEKGFRIDFSSFYRLMNQQKRNSQSTNKFLKNGEVGIVTNTSSKFLGYLKTKTSAKITEIFEKYQLVKQVSLKKISYIILDKTTFYAESGGQIGDSGTIKTKDSIFLVENTKKYGNAIAHIGKLIKGRMYTGQYVTAEINEKKRNRTAKNHTATHLLNSALKKVIGRFVEQKGSLVNDKYLRFDFLNTKKLNIKKIFLIESLINEKIRENILIITKIMSLESSKKENCTYLNCKTYDNVVRVLTIGDFSKELCGGTHAKKTGDLGLFKIQSFSNIGQNISRIEAITGNIAITNVQKKDIILKKILELLNCSINEIEKKIKDLIEKTTFLKKFIEKEKEKELTYMADVLLEKSKMVEKTKLIINYVNLKSRKHLLFLLNLVSKKCTNSVIVFLYTNSEKTFFHVKVTKNVCKYFSAIDILNKLCLQFNGKGGGKKDQSEGVGIKMTNKNNLLILLKNWIEKNIRTFYKIKRN